MNDVTREIDARIAEGLIPPRPDFVHEPEAWRRWYDENIRCVTLNHAYFMRERNSKCCAQCIANGTAATLDPVSFAERALKPPTRAAVVLDVAQTAARRKPRAMP